MSLRSSPLHQCITSPLVLYIVVFAIICVITGENAKDNNSEDKFVPTHEWQVVKKGQPIPKGLHVRVNFETGVTEAKRLDETESSNNVAISTVSEADISNIPENSEKGKITRDIIEEAMKKIKSDYKEEEEETQPSTPFRSYEELKKDFDTLHMNVKTDMELLQDLTSKFLTSTEETKVNILIDLEYLVHQFDNAREFVRLEGFTGIIYPCFNSSNVDIRSEAIKLLGSAVQSNPKVQISAMSTGSIPLLLRALLMDENATVRSRAMYALSCLIRSFPAAQVKMVSEGGIAVLSKAFDKESTKLQLKAVTLINDLLDERQRTRELAQDQNETSEELQQKLVQYEAVDLEQKLIEAGWCHRVPLLLFSEAASPDNDVVEKVLHTMQALFNVCKDSFLHSDVKVVLNKLEDWYKDLAELEQDDYYKNLALLAVNLRSKLLRVHNEL